MVKIFCIAFWEILKIFKHRVAILEFRSTIDSTMTIDELAISIQTEFLDIHHHFDDINSELGDIRAEMRQGFRETKQEISDLRDDMNLNFATHSELQAVEDRLLKEIGKIKYAKEIDDLRHRVGVIEDEIGLSPQILPA